MSALIAVVYHSGFGHTEQLAFHVIMGINRVEGVRAKLFTAEKACKDPTELNEFDAIIFGSPTYMGSVSAPFKTFMDATSKVWMHQNWKNKIAAGFTNSHSMSGDKLNTLIQLTVFAMQHAMIWVGQAELDGSPENGPGEEDKLNRLGSYLGAMAQSANRDPSVTPPTGDRDTAELLGERVGRLALQFKAGAASS